MDMQRKIARILYSQISAGNISFHTALKLFRPISELDARKRTPAGRSLKRQNLCHILDATDANAKTIWTSVLFPSEILHPFGITPLTLEVIVGSFSTLGLSPSLIDSADEMDVPKTMCSFHRALLGLSKARLLNKPLLVGATSIMCDGNVKSFAETARLQGIPFLFIDIPFEESGDAIRYVESQLESALLLLSDISKVKLTKELFGKSITRTNKTIALAKKFYELRHQTDKTVLKCHEQANFAFPMHYLLGSERLIKMMNVCVDSISAGRQVGRRGSSPLRVMWLHIVPQYPSAIWDIIDDGKKSRVVCDEYSNPYFDEYDVLNPLRSIAARLVNHPSNGPINRRIDHILKVARNFRVDAIVHYSSWGCHQASGNIELLGKAMRDAGFQFLNLNGDAADFRNSSFEQHRTRLETPIESA